MIRSLISSLFEIAEIFKCARLAMVKVRITRYHLDFRRENKVIRISRKHLIYSYDIIGDFDYYFDSVEPVLLDGLLICDFSRPSFHEVKGFGLFPLHFPSLAEPLSTTNQYLEFAGLKQGEQVLDLGAYSGLTSIIFKEIVGNSGRVVAVEVDPENLKSLKKNFLIYKKVTGRNLDVVEEAVWNHSNGVNFSSEGNMGSSAVSIVGENRGRVKLVKSSTLGEIAKTLGLEKIAFIKCDVEGAESVIFEDYNFFREHRPRIIVEIHNVSGQSTSAKVQGDLAKFGYTFQLVDQPGTPFPLLQCLPST